MAEDISARLLAELQRVAGWELDLFQTKFGPKFGSPIETAFAASLVMRGRLAGGLVTLSRESAKTVRLAYFLEPQVQIGQYRVDFLLGVGAHADDLSKGVVIECDGHAWHERTKEQAAHDKARDRFLSTQVAKVLRFTGSEIYESPGACSNEAMKVLNLVVREV